MFGEAVLRADAVERGSGAGTTPDEGEVASFTMAAAGGLVLMVLESGCVGALVMRACSVGGREAGGGCNDRGRQIANVVPARLCYCERAERPFAADGGRWQLRVPSVGCSVTLTRGSA